MSLVGFDYLRVLQFKEELMAAMGLNTEEQGSAMAFFRRGYKVITAVDPVLTSCSADVTCCRRCCRTADVVDTDGMGFGADVNMVGGCLGGGAVQQLAQMTLNRL